MVKIPVLTLTQSTRSQPESNRGKYVLKGGCYATYSIVVRQRNCPVEEDTPHDR